MLDDGEADEDNEDITDHLAPCPLSLDAKFPTAVFSQALTRIRSTINNYAKDMQHVNWYQDTKYGTIIALEKRWLQYAEVVAAKGNAEFDISFAQVGRRIRAQVEVLKLLRQHVESSDAAYLAKIVSRLDLLQTYLVSVGVTPASDIVMLRMLATFHHAWG